MYKLPNKTKTVIFKVDEEEFQKIKAMSQEMDRSVSAIVRKMVLYPEVQRVEVPATFPVAGELVLGGRVYDVTLRKL